MHQLSLSLSCSHTHTYTHTHAEDLRTNRKSSRRKSEHAANLERHQTSDSNIKRLISTDSSQASSKRSESSKYAKRLPTHEHSQTSPSESGKHTKRWPFSPLKVQASASEDYSSHDLNRLEACAVRFQTADATGYVCMYVCLYMVSCQQLV
jgi:hypothetical protein